MAVKNTKKPTATTKKTTTNRRTTNTKNTTAKTPVKEPFKREFMGIIYIVLSIVTIFSIMDFDGFLLEFYKKIITFFIGFGMYVLPVALFSLGVLCFTNFKGNVSLRSTCFLIFPLVGGCFAQILIYGDTYNLNFNDLKTIIELGFDLKSAGAIGGFFSVVLESGLSSIGATILLFILSVILIFLCFNLTPMGVYKMAIEFFDKLGYEEDEEQQEYRLSEREKRKIKKEKQKEHVAKLKEAQKQAYTHYREEVEVETPKKYRNIDLALTNEEEQQKRNKENPIPKNEPTSNEKKVATDQWVIDAYERIKKREQNQDNVDYVMDDLNEIELLERKIEGFEQDIKGIEPFTYDDVEKEVSKEIQNIENDISEQDDYIAPITPTMSIETKPEVSFKEPEITIAKSSVTKSDIDEIKQDIKQAIDQTMLENTAEFNYMKPDKVVDELKSTMRYEIVSNFDKDKLKYQYSYPPVDILTPKLAGSDIDPTEELRDSSKRLIETLASFGVAAEIIHIVRGPSITRFEITISKGIKFSKITSLSDDIALSLGAANVRIATIPDKVAIGIEVPNKTTEIVLIREVIDSNEFTSTQSKLSYALGKDITGSPYIGDIAKMPHMLIAGTTGSGKSVCVNSMLVSLLYKATPDEVKFIMIDPKMVELGGYNGIPHLLIPVVTDPRKAAGALNWAVGEMMKRYKLFAESNVKDLVSYNLSVERKIKAGDIEAKKMPQIVIVIDELADLMMIAAKEVEESICRIAQMARAAGMHLVIATQRPSSDVITGIMKANIPSRISFAVSSQIESRIILDTTGAEKLIGKGDMLYNPLGASKPQRLQGCFITSSEVEAVVDYIKTIGEPDYNEEVLNHIESHSSKDGGTTSGDSSDGEEDPMIEEAIEVIVSTGQASTSFLQRKLKLGYARASRIMDQIEDRGIVGAADGSKPRQVLITKSQWYEMKIRKMD